MTMLPSWNLKLIFYSDCNSINLFRSVAVLLWSEKKCKKWFHNCLVLGEFVWPIMLLHKMSCFYLFFFLKNLVCFFGKKDANKWTGKTYKWKCVIFSHFYVIILQTFFLTRLSTKSLIYEYCLLISLINTVLITALFNLQFKGQTYSRAKQQKHSFGVTNHI